MEGVYLVNIPSGCTLQTAIADLAPAVDVDADELVQLPLPFEAARFAEGGEVDEAAVMAWAKKSGGADGWGPKGPTMAEIMESWDQSLLEERPMGTVMKILLTITMVLALIFLVILTLCCWRFRREQLAYGVQLTERVRALLRRSTEDTRRTPPPPPTISGPVSLGDLNANIAPGDGEVSQAVDEFLPYDPPSGRPRSRTPLDSPPPVKRIREGLYQVSRRTAVPSAGRSRRYGVAGVPLHPANFPPVGTSSLQLASRALPPVPAPTPEPEPTVSVVVPAPLGCPDPRPGTSQWVDLRTVPVPVASDTCLLYTSPSPRDS